MVGRAGTEIAGPERGEVTALVHDWERHQPLAADRLFALVDGELRAIARNHLALDPALDRLAAADPDLSRVVELRCFAGTTLEETGELTGRSVAPVQRDWRAARAFLHRELGLLAPPP